MYGKAYKELDGLVEVHFEALGKWVPAHRKGGVKAVQSQPRGKKIGSSRNRISKPSAY